MNSALQKYVDTCESDVKVLDVRKFIHGINDHKDNIRHYQRPVYVFMAEELMTQLAGRRTEVSRLKIVKEQVRQFFIKIRRFI